MSTELPTAEQLDALFKPISKWVSAYHSTTYYYFSNKEAFNLAKTIALVNGIEYAQEGTFNPSGHDRLKIHHQKDERCHDRNYINRDS